MFLYNLTLAKGGGIQIAAYGNFSDAKAHEIVVSKGKILELLRPADVAVAGEGGALKVVSSIEVFGQIRSLMPFRLPGSPTDHLIVGSDSGRIVVLAWNKDRGLWKKVHQETYGRSGCRRAVPGQFLAVDPRGRACLISALERHKLIYVLNRDAAANLTISSPLEAHKSNHLCFGVTGLDMGFENPVFAALEMDCGDVDTDASGDAARDAQKVLAYYELDLGLNTVKRTVEEAVDNGANLLVPVPGGVDGPGGVLVCAENFIYYMRLKEAAELAAGGAGAGAHAKQLQVVIPRRLDLPPERSVLITSYTSFKSKRAGFFFLLQSEYGDLYKATLAYDPASNTVSDLTIKYFDTIPPCASIAILKTGFLFAASEFGNHGFYQFQGMGEGDDVSVSASTCQPSEEGAFEPVFFTPRGLENLALIDEMSSLSPILDMRVENVTGEEAPQIYALCGRGPRSSLRVLRPGISVAEMVAVDLPERPQSIFSLRRSVRDATDSFLVVSYATSTIVLAIQEGQVTQVTDSGLIADQTTLRVQLMADDSIVQVCPRNIRHVLRDRRTIDWDAPTRKGVERASTNDRQVCVALRGGDLLYFELDSTTQRLKQTGQKEIGSDIASLDVAPVPLGRTRAQFLAVGSHDSTVKIYSLDPDSLLQVCGMQHCEAAFPSSLLFMDSDATSAPGLDRQAVGGTTGGALFLQVGLSSGVLMRVQVDRTSGQLSDSRWRFLGLTAPKLVPVIVKGRRAMIALSKRPWLGYMDMGRYLLSPLSYDALDHVAPFASEDMAEGLVAVAGPKTTSQAGMRGTMRFISPERLGEPFSQAELKLRYTPRRLVVHPEGRLVICEADTQVVPLVQRSDLAPPPEMGEGGEAAGPELDPATQAKEEQFGAPKGPLNSWASCVRLVDPAAMETKHVVELEEGEATVSACLVSFASNPELGSLVAVGTSKGLELAPRKHQGGAIRLYRLATQGDGSQTLELLHKTDVEGVPGALLEFHGRLLAGVDNVLRLFDLGKKRLLRKCECRRLPHHIVSLAVMGRRLYATDVQDSAFFLKYRVRENEFYVFADDSCPRYVSSSCLLDYDTLAVSDKFANVAVLRLPQDASAKVEADPSGGKALQTGGQGNAAFKLAAECSIHVGDVVTSLHKATLQQGGAEVLLYATVGGSIGALYPVGFKEDADFLQHLEMHLRQDAPPLLGRDHLAYRSSYFPVRSVVDGDLCEMYGLLRRETQESIAEGLDRTVGEVQRKLEAIRDNIF